MKAFSPTSDHETRQANQERKRSISQNGLSAEADASRASRFVDNRLEAIAQRKLQALTDRSPQVQRLANLEAMANNSPRVKARAQSQAMIDNSPRQVTQRTQLERTFGPAVQRQERLEEEDALQMQTEPGTLQRQSLEDEALLQGKRAPVQRQAELDEDASLQGKFDPVQRQGLEDEELIQGEFAAGDSPMQFKEDPEQQENRTGMPDKLKAGIENLSGMAMDDVKVHYNSDQPTRLQALAYAQGTDIHVGPGQEKHLPHEAWHVVQQIQGRVKPTVQAHGVAINDDGDLEREADVMGAKALQLTRGRIPTSGSGERTRENDSSTQSGTALLLAGDTLPIQRAVNYLMVDGGVIKAVSVSRSDIVSFLRGNKMGRHTTAQQVIVDAVRRCLAVGNDLVEAVQELKTLGTEIHGDLIGKIYVGDLDSEQKAKRKMFAGELKAALKSGIPNDPDGVYGLAMKLANTILIVSNLTPLAAIGGSSSNSLEAQASDCLMTYEDTGDIKTTGAKDKPLKLRTLGLAVFGDKGGRDRAVQC